MIPVIGIPVVNKPEYLQKTLDTIDEEVGRLIVIDNSVEGEITANMEGPNLTVIRPNHNLGVSCSWNLIIKASPLAKWWCILNADLELMAGDLERLREYMEEGAGGFGLLVTPSAFGIDATAIDRAGWFDENFVPGYFEDNDYVRRCDLTGVPVARLHAGLTHIGSTTIRGDTRMWLENMRTFPQNKMYYIGKWGGEPTQETFTTPFNRGGHPSEWRLSITRLQDQTWRLE